MPRATTQAERRAATRGAVLEATVALLAERGYAGTSTRLAADRAGISLGALQHHFPTKAELSVAAMRHASERLAHEFVTHTSGSLTEVERLAAVLDRLVVVFCGPAAAASMELVVAARTDRELQRPVRALVRDWDTLIRETAVELLPELSQAPEFDGLVALTIASMRGMTLTASRGAPATSAGWEHIRAHLLTAAETALEGTPA